MAITQNGITFNNLSKIGTGSRFANVINTDIQSESDLKEYIDAGEEYRNIQSVLIDWNGAQLSYVSLPNILDNGNTINTTGQLLALINDLQEQINAIVYIINNGSGTVTPVPDEPTYLKLISEVAKTAYVNDEQVNMDAIIPVKINDTVTIRAIDVDGYSFESFRNHDTNSFISSDNSIEYTISSPGTNTVELLYSIITDPKPSITTTTSTSTLPPSNPTQLTISVGKQNVQVTVDGVYITGGHTMPVNVGQQVIIRAYSSNNTSIGFYNINDLINPITENVSKDGDTYTLSYIIKSTGEHHIVIK